MSIKSLGLALWTNSTPRSSSISINRKSSSSSSISSTTIGFGLPSLEDPDPFGVKALELAGLEIREAGSSIRPSIDVFEYRPSPTSPVFRLSTQSLDLAISGGESRSESQRSSKRISKRSLFSLRSGQAINESSDLVRERTHSISEVSYSPWNGKHSRSESKSSLSEMRNITPYTIGPVLPPRGSSSACPVASLPPTLSLREFSPIFPVASPTIATFAIDGGIISGHVDTDHYPSRTVTPKSSTVYFPQTINETLEEESEDDIRDSDDEEDFIIEELSTSTAPVIPTILATPLAVKAKIVSIKRKGPPALPFKNPLRQGLSGPSTQDELSEDQDGISSACSLSPDKGVFDKVEDSPNPWSEDTSIQDNESVIHADLERDSLSISDHDVSDQSQDLDKKILDDVMETTPIASRSLFILPWTTQGAMRDAIRAGTMTESISPTDLTPVATAKFEPETPSTSDHKTSISGTTLASITSITISKSNSEQSLAGLIKQGLSAGPGEEDDNEDTTLDYYYKPDDLSDYEDDAPVSPTSLKELHYSTPGSFEPPLLQ